MTDTIEITAPARLTATLRPADDLPAGDYRLNPARCVVELAVCVLRRPAVRARIEAAGGTLTVGDLTTLELDLRTASPRTRVPFLGRHLAAGLDEPLALRTRVVHTDEDTVVLTASGPLPARWSRVELAAEFVR